MDNSQFLTEIPSSLKRLARLVARGFYSVEHVIVVDILIRNPCMKEDDLVELLKFERKQLRTIIAQLKNDKFIKIKLKMETGPDGKTSRQNYYFINYKVFVNVVKYKLDHMRRKIELEERDSTSRSSFKCPSCLKTFTDLEANQLFDFTTNEFRCTFCNSAVEEDQSALPKQDMRLVQAKFNEQTEPIYTLLQDVEDIKLAPELLEPEPTDLTDVKKSSRPKNAVQERTSEPTVWSGDATRSRELGFSQDVNISFGDDNTNDAVAAIEPVKKERPVWMVESTVAPAEKEDVPVFSISNDQQPTYQVGAKQDDIMEVLLAHEKKLSDPIIPGANEADSGGSDAEASAMTTVGMGIEEMDDDDDEEALLVTVGNRSIPLHEIREEDIAQMTPAEKEAYIKISQEVYSNIYD